MSENEKKLCPKPKWWQQLRERHCMHQVTGERFDSHPLYHNGLEPAWVSVRRCCRCEHEETRVTGYGDFAMEQ